MGAVYQSVCYEADTLLLLAINLVEKEIQLKLAMEKLMNDGFVNIAKARYIMGSTCVTKMQLPSGNSNPIKPLATVERRPVNNSWIFYVMRANYSKSNESVGEGSEEQLNNPKITYETKTSKTGISSVGRSEAAFKNLMQNDTKSLKKSKNAFLVEDDLYQEYNDELLDEMSNPESNESLVSVTDPIRLFGILVPNVLKQAQVVFIDIVNLLGECATVQLELSETLDKFNHIIKVKNLIEAAASEMKLDILTPKVYWTPPESSSVSCSSFKSEEELSEKSKISVQKSIRSVFYDVREIEPQEAEFSVWGSANTESNDGSKN